MAGFYLLEIWLDMCMIRPCKRVESSGDMLASDLTEVEVSLGIGSLAVFRIFV
jgi:hypothetical protein